MCQLIVVVVVILKQYYAVPQTPLPSVEILKEERDAWSEVQQNMGKALDEMRINWDSKVKVKELNTVKNPLLERRMKKTKVDGPSTTTPTTTTTMTPPPPVGPKENRMTITTMTTMTNENSNAASKNDLVVENISREASMISVKSITPTNSVVDNNNQN